MLTERGFDEALQISDVPAAEKESLPIKSYEVQKVINKLVAASRPENYEPFDRTRKLVKTTRETGVRLRGFRQAVIEVYDFRCAVCGLKINSPNSLCWEVEAAHIVPHGSLGRDDHFQWNRIVSVPSLGVRRRLVCAARQHKIQLSSKLSQLPSDFGRVGDYEFVRSLTKSGAGIHLPRKREIYPQLNSLRWHRKFVFYQ
jgi:putative restriction endonuclease